jgi:sporulation protein YlmC with PRC-barrel domain
VPQRLRFEHLIGRQVRNSHGRVIGRIEEARIEPDGEEYVITHFLIGPAQRLARLRAFLGELPTLRSLGIGKERDLRPFPWHWIDLTDPERPVLTEASERQET